MKNFGGILLFIGVMILLHLLSDAYIESNKRVKRKYKSLDEYSGKGYQDTSPRVIREVNIKIEIDSNDYDPADWEDWIDNDHEIEGMSPEEYYDYTRSS